MYSTVYVSIPTSQFILPSFPPCNPQFIDSSSPYDKNHKSTPCSRIRCKSYININTGWKVEVSFLFLPGPICPLQSPVECPAVTTVSRGVCFLLHSSMNFPIWRSFFVSCAWRVSVQFSCSVMSNSLQPHELQHTRLPCPSPTPRAYSNSCPLSQWCHPIISSSVIPFSSCLQSFLASRFLPVSQSSHQVAKILEFQLQHQSFQWIFRTDFL